eukprot:UN33630
MNSDVCTRENLVDVDRNTINKVIRDHCVRPLCYGSENSNKIKYDLQALEQDIQIKYVLGKGEVRYMLPFFEFAGEIKINSIFESTGLPKDRLDKDILEIVTNYQSGLERQHALEMVEETIFLLGRLGVDTKEKSKECLYQFMKDVLRMEKRDYELFNHPDYGSEVQLRHLHCLYEYLHKRVDYDDPKRKQSPEKTLS